MAYLTVNADDFGMTHGVTLGIYQSITKGIVTSTSAMACMDHAEEHLRAYAGITPGIIGAHLQLTNGKPVLPPETIPSLVDKNGYFYANSKMLPWHLNADEILAEWNAQIERLQQWDVDPRYLDSHHHVHLIGQVLPVMARLAKSRRLPVRSGPAGTSKKIRYLGAASPDVSIFDFFGDSLSWEKLERLVSTAIDNNGKDAVIELACHPGISSPELAQLSFYHRQREAELVILTQEGARERLEELGLILIGMDQVGSLRGV